MQKADRNPSSGLPTRNPSHIFEADRANDQSDIVKAIKSHDIGRQGQITWTYDEATMEKGPPPLSGIRKVREMSEDQAKKFCRSLLRVQPNIYRVHLVLGSYENKREINNAKTRTLFSSTPRFPTEVGDDFGAILADKSMLVTEVIYEVLNADPGNFRAFAKIYGVNERDYADDELFSPAIQLDYIKAT
jgi:hypothetical protein